MLHLIQKMLQDFKGLILKKDFNRTSRNPDLNTAEIIYKTYTKMGTPEFCDSIDTEANHRSILEYDVDEDEQIDILLNQVSTLDLNIFNSVKAVQDKNLHPSSKFVMSNKQNSK